VAISAVAVRFTAVAAACGAPPSAGLLEGAEVGWPALVFDTGASVVAAAGGSAFDRGVSVVVAAGGSAFLVLVVHPEPTRIANTKQPNTLCRSFI
jgi:hypothetical protein